MQTKTFQTDRTAAPETPQIKKLPANERGRTRFGWLDSRHSFSFGEYFDADRMGYRSLRVLNDDVVAPGQGFGMHPHRDAEIFTYVISGVVQHRDSLGHEGLITAGNLQYMSAGDGVMHSEFNGSKSEPTHFLQIWLRPNEHGGEPRYAEKALGDAAAPNALTLLFAPTARDGAQAIRQDAEIYFGKLEGGKTLPLDFGRDRYVWIQQIAGKLSVGDESLEPGDAVTVAGTDSLTIRAERDAEFLVFILS